MIFLFDDNGSYITKIHNIGSGPGEYADISDFDIDADLNIYISSIVGRKIIKYKYPDNLPVPVKMDTEAIPGFVSGRMIWKNTLNTLPPSI